MVEEQLPEPQTNIYAAACVGCFAVACLVATGIGIYYYNHNSTNSQNYKNSNLENIVPPLNITQNISGNETTSNIDAIV